MYSMPKQCLKRKKIHLNTCGHCKYFEKNNLFNMPSCSDKHGVCSRCFSGKYNGMITHKDCKSCHRFELKETTK